jgi:hypothetical protein
VKRDLRRAGYKVQTIATGMKSKHRRDAAAIKSGVGPTPVHFESGAEYVVLDDGSLRANRLKLGKSERRQAKLERRLQREMEQEQDAL